MKPAALRADQVPADLVSQTDEPVPVLGPRQAERSSLREEWHEDDIAIHRQAACVLFALRQPLRKAAISAADR